MHMDEKIQNIVFILLVIGLILGSAILFALGSGAKQDAWIVLLLGIIIGLILGHLYLQIYSLYPGETFGIILERVYGKSIGRFLTILYGVYFLYIASRVMRDFTEFIGQTILVETPKWTLSVLLVLLILYALIKGLHIIGYVTLFVKPLVLIMLIFSYVYIYFSQHFHIENLLPVLAEGFLPVLKEVFPGLATFPFGEIIVFLTIFPRVENQNKLRQHYFLGILIGGGVLLMGRIAMLGVLGPGLVEMLQFPLLTLMQFIEIQGIERWDIIMVLIMFLEGSLKFTLFTYAGIQMLQDALGKRKGWLIYASCITVGLLSNIIAFGYAEHVKIGLALIPKYVHIPMLMMLPFITYGIGRFQRYKKGV